MFKFNNGRGAIICDRCSVIIQEDVDCVFIDKSYTEHVCYNCVVKENERNNTIAWGIVDEIIQRD